MGVTAPEGGAGPVRSTLRVSGRDVTLLRGGGGGRGGGGVTLLYLHGLCDIHAVWPGDEWTAFLSRLAARFDVVAPALPGYNASTGLDELDDVEDYVFHLADVCEAAGLDQPVAVVGHSLGGWFATELALRRPDVVARLVLLGPLGVHVRGIDVPPFFGAVAPRGIGGAGEARSLLFADPDGPVATGALPDFMTTDQQLLWFAGLAGAARLGWKAPHFQNRKLTQRLGRLRVPSRVVRGEHDRLVPAEAGRTWAASVPGASLVEIPDAGHCLPLERPDVAAAEVESFLVGPH
jgi:pimeloyl-ACP methyl ester carboxylesterase